MVRVQLCFHSTRYSSPMVYTLMTVILFSISCGLSPLNNVCSLLIVLLRVHFSSLAEIATSPCRLLPLHHSPRPCYFPRVMFYYCTTMPSSNPVIGHMLHIFSTTVVSGILSPVPDPNMIHCFHQQPLARTVRTPHLHKPVLPGTSLTPTSNLLARSYTQADTGFSLFGHSSQHGVLVVWPLPAIASFPVFGLTIRRAIASTLESAATTGYLLLVCRSQTPFRLAESVFLINTYWTFRLE